MSGRGREEIEAVFFINCRHAIGLGSMAQCSIQPDFPSRCAVSDGDEDPACRVTSGRATLPPDHRHSRTAAAGHVRRELCSALISPITPYSVAAPGNTCRCGLFERLALSACRSALAMQPRPIDRVQQLAPLQTRWPSVSTCPPGGSSSCRGSVRCFFEILDESIQC